MFVASAASRPRRACKRLETTLLATLLWAGAAAGAAHAQELDSSDAPMELDQPAQSPPPVELHLVPRIELDRAPPSLRPRRIAAAIFSGVGLPIVSLGIVGIVRNRGESCEDEFLCIEARPFFGALTTMGLALALTGIVLFAAPPRTRRGRSRESRRVRVRSNGSGFMIDCDF